eukprot:698641-Hanusia_phi.AAC.1
MTRTVSATRDEREKNRNGDSRSDTQPSRLPQRGRRRGRALGSIIGFKPQACRAPAGPPAGRLRMKL